MYADYTQLYIMFESHLRDQSSLKLNACISDVRLLATKNMLKINDSKTEAMHFSSKFRSFQPTAVTVGEAVIAPVEIARNLGVIVDKNLTMDDQLKNVCRSATAALRTIGKIRRYLTKSATQTLIQSFVMSRLDFCNSLLYGLPKNKIRKLQTLQNAAARIISRAPRRHDTSHLLRDLHWLFSPPPLSLSLSLPLANLL
eukprot:XP_003726954.1 PREDICTED: uncharacterized protein LOC100892812 [Strongylocentrotus purpuratus]